MIGCDDVINQLMAGRVGARCSQNGFRNHLDQAIFARCTVENDVAFIETHNDFINGDIKSLIVLFDTIFATTSSSIYTYSRNELTKIHSAMHNIGHDAFLYMPPYVDDAHFIAPMMAVCNKASSPLNCIRYTGASHRNINLFQVIRSTFADEEILVRNSLAARTDPRYNNYPDFEAFQRMRLVFFRFILSEQTRNVSRDSIEPFLPYSLIIIGAGSDFPRHLNLIHPLYPSISFSCLPHNNSSFYDSYETINYNLNPATMILSMFIRDNYERKIYVASVHRSVVMDAFKSRNFNKVHQQLCEIELVSGVRTATGGIRLNDDTFVITNGREMPVIVEKDKDPILVYWSHNAYQGSDYEKVVFVSSSEDSSEVYGYSGNKILKLTRKIPKDVKLSSKLRLILIICLPIILILIIIIIALITMKKYGYRKTKPLLDKDEELNERPTAPPRPPMTLVPFYDSSNITVTENIKEGHFGDVRRGFLHSNGMKIDVAIKTLKRPDSKILTAEAEIIIALDHPNVLKLLGIEIDGLTHQPISLLFPFMINGDLLEYLCLRKAEVSANQQLKFAIDVAAGMMYLTSQNIVHRDLAARNCFLDKYLVVKVGDFGLSRIIEDGYSVRSTGNSLIPANHAPDVAETGFNESTDVWSFGWLLFEIFSFGSCSIPDQYIIPRIIFKLMKSCQSKKQKKRPTFSEIFETLTSIDDYQLRLLNKVADLGGYVTIKG